MNCNVFWSARIYDSFVVGYIRMYEEGRLVVITINVEVIEQRRGSILRRYVRSL
jgi:hypothetical protein